MDLNNLRPPPPESPKPLRVVRLSPRNEEVETEVFDGGESLPESQGYDVGLPMSPEEREALLAQGYTEAQIDGDEPYAVGLVDKGFDDEGDGMDIDLSHLSPEQRAAAEFTRDVIRQLPGMPLRTGPGAMDQAMRDLRIQAEAAKALAEHERYVAENFHVRMCPLPTCDAGVRVAKGEDEGDVLGIGMSMKAAMQLEEELVGHLREHTLGDWMAALKEQAEMISRLGQQAFGAPVPQPGVFRASEESTQRSPEAQAAVDALDARMRSKAGGTGGLRPPPPPEEAAQRDQRLRELRRQRRERQPSPYDLSPKYSADPSFSGQVGIKY